MSEDLDKRRILAEAEYLASGFDFAGFEKYVSLALPYEVADSICDIFKLRKNSEEFHPKSKELSSSSAHEDESLSAVLSQRFAEAVERTQQGEDVRVELNIREILESQELRVNNSILQAINKSFVEGGGQDIFDWSRSADTLLHDILGKPKENGK